MQKLRQELKRKLAKYKTFYLISSFIITIKISVPWKSNFKNIENVKKIHNNDNIEKGLNYEQWKILEQYNFMDYQIL